MKEIKLSKTGTKYFGLVALVDDEDFERLNKWDWHVGKGNRTFYARRFTTNTIKREGIHMHKEILICNASDLVVDHKDGNGLNNQKNNLRIATHSQNVANRRSHKNSTSKYLGVSWNSQKKLWQAAIMTNYKTTYLGCFDIETEAAEAYNEAAKTVHGEFARLNKF